METKGEIKLDSNALAALFQAVDVKPARSSPMASLQLLCRLVSGQ